MTPRFFRFTIATLVLLALAPLVSQTRAPAQPPASSGSSSLAVAIRGATLVTVTRGTIANGTVVLRNGKIAAVGTNVAIPAGADIVDGAGKFVSPGIIDAHSHIAADSINEGGTTVSSMTGIEDVLDPTDINIYRDLAGGLTVANVLHGSANPIGGKNSVIKLRWGKKKAEELLFEGAMPGIKFALGENPKDMPVRAATGPRRYPVTRAGVEFVIRDAFTRAKAYRKDWQEYDRRKKAGEDVLAPRRDLQLEPLVEILEGKRLVHAHCYRADEILMMIRLAEEMGFKIATFQHVLEGYKVAKEMAAHGAGGSTFSDWWGYKIEAVDAIPYNAAIMLRKGVLVSINSDSAEHARRLNTEAAKSIHWGGITEDEALSMVTINPAKQLRIDSRVGSLETGKDADVVIWNRHPLSSYAIVERTYIDGQLYYDRQADERRLTQLFKDKETLAAAERAERRSPTAETPQANPPKAGSDTDDVRPSTLREPQGRPEPGRGATGSGRTDASSVMVARLSGLETALARAAGTSGSAQARGAQSSAGVLAITNARIVPVTQPVIERGTIVIRDGRIAAVGAGVAVPAGAQVIDASGREVYPGWINGRSTIGLAEPGAGGYQDTGEMLDFNPQLRTRVSFHSDSDAIPVARANGVTTAAIAPSGGLLGGEVPVMNLDGWTWEENTVAPVVGISFQFPPVGGGGGRGGGGGGGEGGRSFEELKKDRDARLDEVVRLFDQARAYAKAAGPGRRTDWVLEALVPVVERRVPLITRADRESEIRDAIAFCEKQNVKMILSAGPEAALVAPLLKENNIPVILGPILTPPSREDMMHAASYQTASILQKAGVKFAFATGDANYVRNLPYQAAQSVAWGLPRDEAVKALTINAAEILGVADRLGSIETGKMANLLIAKGDPLEVRNEVTHVIINGRDVGVANKHLALYERYSRRP